MRRIARFSLVGVVPRLDDRAEDQIRVVVATLCARRELLRLVEQPRDRRRAECPEERELERAGRVERELVDRVDLNDALRIALRVERENLAQPG
jgi:hypothetical protein